MVTATCRRVSFSVRITQHPLLSHCTDDRGTTRPDCLADDALASEDCETGVEGSSTEICADIPGFIISGTVRSRAMTARKTFAFAIQLALIAVSAISFTVPVISTSG